MIKISRCENGYLVEDIDIAGDVVSWVFQESDNPAMVGSEGYEMLVWLRDRLCPNTSGGTQINITVEYPE